MGAARLPERTRSHDRSTPPAAVTATLEPTAARVFRGPPASPLTRRAPAVGRTCQMPNTPFVAAIAAPPGMTRHSAAWSIPRKAVSSHSTVPSGMRTMT
jgi:hypothetical protein